MAHAGLIQRIVDEAISDGDPTTTPRRGRVVDLPHGATFSVEKPILVRSVEHLTFRGNGSTLRAVADMDSVLDLDGIAYSRFQDLNFEGSAGVQVTNAIHQHWGAGTYRSCSHNRYDSIHIFPSLDFVNGFAVGLDNANQNDGTNFYGCVVAGSWTPGSARWEYGWRFGNDQAGNNLNHHLYGCGGGHVERGVGWLGSSGGWFGGQIGANGTDFYQGTPGGHLVVQAVRSEYSGRLFDQGGPSGAKAVVSFSDIDWWANGLAPDGALIRARLAGVLSTRGIQVHGPASVLAASGGPLTVTMDGWVADQTAEAMQQIGTGEPVTWDVRNHAVR